MQKKYLEQKNKRSLKKTEKKQAEQQQLQQQQTLSGNLQSSVHVRYAALTLRCQTLNVNTHLTMIQETVTLSSSSSVAPLSCPTIAASKGFHANVRTSQRIQQYMGTALINNGMNLTV
uniref:Uncharacterized protein n=1 Tax=Anopheles culicifacies TaxID=139723 RepID=A0A182MTH3_9DIPT